MTDAAGAWRADPFGRHEYRYWDGSRWTEHVSDRGLVGSDPIPADDKALLPPPPGPVAHAAPGQVVYVTPPRSNGLAIASMVLGIVWVYGIGSILAVIFGHVALSQIKRSRGEQRGRGMAIAGLVLGYLGIVALVAIIVAIASIDFDEHPDAYTCRDDAQVLTVAEDAYRTENGADATEDELVGRYLQDESHWHDIRLSTGREGYELVGVNGCPNP